VKCVTSHIVTAPGQGLYGGRTQIKRGETTQLQLILRDKNRLAVFEEFSSGERSVEQIIKKSRLPGHTIKKAVDDLRVEGIVGGLDSKLYLTEKGRKLVIEVKKVQHEAPAMGAAPKARGRSEVGRIDSVDKRRHIEDRRV
jgi:predicted methyltransferase